jgi:hypothetical protein
MMKTETVMEDIVIDEARRVNAKPCSSEFEISMMGEIAEWIMSQPEVFHDMKNAINAYWNERLN